MHLRGQHGQRGYAMAALLTALAVMSVLMSAVLPAWRHQAQREKEAELIFRGEQYVRAISLWERRHGPGTRPPNVDVLLDQRFLRKKYRDPMTEDGEFQLLFAGVNPPAGAPGGQRGAQPGAQPAPPTPFAAAQGGGGLYGVVSRSREMAIRIYPRPGPQAPGVQSEPRRYNEWLFVHAGAAATPGGGPTAPQPGGIGAPGGRGRGGVAPGGGGGFGPGGRGLGPGGRGLGPGGRGTPGPNRPN